MTTSSPAVPAASPPADAAALPLTWDLDSILPHPKTDDFARILQQYREDLQAVADRSDKLLPVRAEANVVAAWDDFLRDYAAIDTRANDLGSFIGCHAAAEAGNELFLQIEGALSALNPLRQRIATNVEFALKEASDAEFTAFVQAHPNLQQLQFYLEQSRANAAKRLPRDQELLAADLGVDGIHAWGRLYDRVSGSLRVKLMEKGEIVERSPGQVRLDLPDRATRQNNFYASDKAWAGIEDTCADALNHIAGTRLTLYRRLGLKDHLEMPLHYNRMQRETLDAMWGVITERKGILLKYLETKARALGLPKLAWYDQLAPYPASGPAAADLPYADACDRINTAFSGFSGELGEFSRKALRERWIEVENRGGKRQGGFCTGFPGKQQSRIFMTYKNNADDMSTLAHELGHAYHSYVLRGEPLFHQDYPMNLAETASTFAEAVLNEERLKHTTVRGEQLEILDAMLGDAVAFLMNIHCRFIFEDRFHQERLKGEVSTARLCELMQAAQQEAYLNGLADDGWNPRFWVSKLHFYISGLPFYNFPYTFGYLLSLGVYALASEAGPDFPEQYRKLLIATGCMNAEDAVKSTFGYDLTQPDFWRKSLEIIERRVERFVALAAE